jgi:nucleoid-associated protein YgaU
MTMDEVRDLNPGVVVDRMAPGDRVRIYADAARALGARPEPRVARVARGDAQEARSEPRLTGRPAEAEGSEAPRLAGRPTTAEATEGPRVAGRPASSATSVVAASDAARHTEHRVQPGETLWSIARSYFTTVDSIRAANGMQPDTVIQAGQTLRIPRRAGDR